MREVEPGSDPPTGDDALAADYPDDRLEFIAFSLDEHSPDCPLNASSTVVAPALRSRPWMRNSIARRCLPMLIANQAGWEVRTPVEVRARWLGGPSPDDLEVEVGHGGIAVSHFGYGILTWIVPYLFRTPPGWNLHVRGPVNMPKDGASSLEGIVETDWLVSTFTYNWKLTRAGSWITFAAGEAFCVIVPVRRGELEQWSPRMLRLAENPELAETYSHWRADRVSFNHDQDRGDAWEKDYYLGRLPGTVTDRFPAHQFGLALRPLADG